MIDLKSKELIIKPTVDSSTLAPFLSKLRAKGILTVNVDPKVTSGDFRTIHDSKDADMIICTTIDQLRTIRSSGKVGGYYSEVLSNQDVDEIERASQAGAEFVVVHATNWKIIPLENIIAKLHKSDTKVYATAKSSQEVGTLFAVLQLGVDGVILSTDSEEEVDKAREQLISTRFMIKPAKVVEVRDVGTGERVCVDTASMMKMGEGMLVGSKSNFMLLVHNEAVGSSFTSPRPFRINAGAVYCYTIVPGGTTSYLSEIESGSEVWIVNTDGIARNAVVGRSKIETRPLKLIRATIEGETGTVILQNAETIRLVARDGKLLSVTEVQAGDEVLGYAKQPSGRHFGSEVNEFIMEK